jgi:hypothetical protein
MGREPPFRRLILEMAHGGADARVLRAAVAFARVMGLSVQGLFVEDEAVLALPALPFARELRLPDHRWRPLDAAALRAELAHAATDAHRRLETALRRARVPGGFEVLRGDPAEVLARLSGAEDIVVIAGRPAQTVRATLQLAELRKAAWTSPAAMLLLPPMGGAGAGEGAVAAVIIDAEDGALELTCRIALSAAAKLVVVVPPSPGDALARLVTDRALAAGMPREHLRVREAEDTPTAAQVVLALRPRLVVVPRRYGEQAVHPLLAAADVAVLLVAD